MQMKVIENIKFRSCVAFTIVILSFVFCSIGYAEDPKTGQKYKIIKSIHIMGVYDDLNNRKLSKETARGYLHPIKFANRPHVAFRTEVPAGTTMTIISVLKNPWYRPFLKSRFLVKLDPDLSQGLDVEIELARGLEGNLDGLNSEIFSRE
ncbi:MAG: hypothetical protein NDI63_07850 [Pseudobdellovibrio sp.]|nr:hypothetical protein [Pseudobdellovibrio sp.]